MAPLWIWGQGCSVWIGKFCEWFWSCGEGFRFHSLEDNARDLGVVFEAEDLEVVKVFFKKVEIKAPVIIRLAVKGITGAAGGDDDMASWGQKELAVVDGFPPVFDVLEG